MRHFIASCPVTACPFGMRAPSMTAGLVARAGGPLTSPPSEPAAASGAIDLAAVTATANQRLSAATRADEQACRRCIVMARTADDTWTNAAVAPILALHTCPGTVWGTASNETARFERGAVPCSLRRTSSYRAIDHSVTASTIARRGTICSPKPRHGPSVFRRSINSADRRIYTGSGRHRHHH
jgi:hypothetical protein